ncbi:MAG: DNA-3-methyladenine glycosylase [Candidatus Nealsonbacteria bacterium CG_4_9_14_3_um_filter_35_11]|nr:MAG: DNA-3-methyladenine glycosylase [Candidatus Nealsonbacteria bacterium CG_4_8_14_3_um_filter_34_13]PJA84482.1 MAG: DNA-3-methyladenine glycosylase [Candidatus Nealsonbacteria bacterium CG_4_9_14_3_um_filter_35_11]
MRLKRNFYKKNTLKVAQDLLAKYIVRVFEGKKIIGQIVETEAYIGPRDKASHGFGGKITQRNRAEYLIGGYVYIYLVYGMYWQLNITAGLAGRPECVLIRALEPISELKVKSSAFALRASAGRQNSKILKNLTNGPGKLCSYLKLDKSFYGEDLVKSKRIWLEDRGEKVKPSQIITKKRIGIDYAGTYWANKKWRFYIKDNPFISKN